MVGDLNFLVTTPTGAQCLENFADIKQDWRFNNLSDEGKLVSLICIPLPGLQVLNVRRSIYRAKPKSFTVHDTQDILVYLAWQW